MVFNLVPGAGIEPAWSCLRGILSPLRMPIPPSRQRIHDKTGAIGSKGVAPVFTRAIRFCSRVPTAPKNRTGLTSNLHRPFYTCFFRIRIRAQNSDAGSRLGRSGSVPLKPQARRLTQFHPNTSEYPTDALRADMPNIHTFHRH